MTRTLTSDDAAPRHFFLNADGLNESATLKTERGVLLRLYDRLPRSH